MAARRLSRNLKDLRFLQSHPSPATNLSSGSAYRNVGDLKILNPHFPAVVREIHGLTHPVSSKNVANCKLPFAMGITRRLFSADISSLPSITDPDIKAILKDLMAASWDELPHAVVVEAGIVLSKSTEDSVGQEALANVLRAAEAVEHFAGVLVSLRMELDDSIGINGEKVGRMAEYLQDALDAAYKRYVTYLDAFGPDEVYLRKKVENELGTKMIQIKLRCGGLGSEWGKVTVLGTSGLAGSYVEHRAP